MTMWLQTSPIPLYYQLQEHLLERIRGGEFRPGDPLPTEGALSAQYGVSRITVRRALDQLLSDAIIVRRRGVGTFVAHPQQPIKSLRLVGSLDDSLAYRELAYKLLSKETVTPPSWVAQALALAPEAPVVRLEVTCFSEREPFAYAEYFYPEEIGARIDEADLARGVPILKIVEEKVGRRISRAEQTVEPALSDPVVASHLGMKPHAPVLKVRRTDYVLDDRPVEAVIIRYHPERYRYTVQLVAQPGRS